MPIYVYEVIGAEDSEPTIEVLQGMNESPLTHHPETGVPIRRRLSAPAIVGMWTESAAKKHVSDKNLAAKGFTKYVKSGDGRYEKTVGSGPKSISASELKRRQQGG
jgi:hypothetical protein